MCARVLAALGVTGRHPCPPGHLCEQCLDAPAVAFVAAPWGGEMGVCAPCGGLEPTVPAGPCVQHPLDRAHSPIPTRYGPTVAVTCGVCGTPCVTTAVRWQAEVERRHASTAGRPAQERSDSV